MATSKAQEIRVGIVTAIAIIALVGSIVWGKGLALGVSSQIVNIHFQSASGIEIGAPVTVFGVRKGNVLSVNLVHDGVRVVASVESSVVLHADAQATIEMPELMGGKKIEINPGTSSNDFSSGSEILGSSAADISSLLSTASDLSIDVRLLLRHLDSTVSTVNDLVSDQQLNDDLRNTMGNLAKTSASANDFIMNNQQFLQRTIRNLDLVSTDLKAIVTRTGVRIDSTINSVGLVADDAQRLMTTLDRTAMHSDSLIGNLDKLVLEMRNGDGVLSKLLYDKTFAAELEATIQAARAYIEQIRVNGVNLNFSVGRRP